jgi:maltokinase
VTSSTNEPDGPGGRVGAERVGAERVGAERVGAERVGEEEADLLAYVSAQRWFGGHGGEVRVRRVIRLPRAGAGPDGPWLGIDLVEVEFDGVPTLYQVPVALHRSAVPGLAHAWIGYADDPEAGRVHVYDAAHDPVAIALLTRGFTGPPVPGLEHHTTGPVQVDESAGPMMLTGEQSNTSVVIGADLLLKVFRKVEVGHNPDIEVHAAIAGLANSHADAETEPGPGTGTRAGLVAPVQIDRGLGVVAPLRGWIRTTTDGPAPGIDLAMLQDFLRTAVDGWTYARNSVRDLLNEGDLYAEEVGGDFAAEAERLGRTTARLHGALALALQTQTWSDEDLASLATRLHARLEDAVVVAPELEPYLGGLRRGYDALEQLSAGQVVQRVHGDFHLGQVLRDVDGWRVIDLEGEPAAPIAERTVLDSPLRDIAGMLRSLDYAAHSVALQFDDSGQVQHRTVEWVARNSDAFLAGYAAEGGTDPVAELVLLRAYEVDKAVYEVVYETRNRPTWVPIPLAALARLVGGQELS